MNLKTCEVINKSFELDESYNILLKDSKGKVKVTDGMEKGYVYAALYFYDETQKEVEKLGKMVRRVQDEILLDVNIEDPAVLFAELSKRVRAIIGDDSLDILIKEVIGETKKHIALIPEKAEIEKFDVVKESIFTELLANFYDMTVKKAASDGRLKTFTFAAPYVEKMTPRQKRLVAPAIKMVAFLNNTKLEAFEIDSDFCARFETRALSELFSAKEKSIKDSLKKLMASVK